MDAERPPAVVSHFEEGFSVKLDFAGFAPEALREGEGGLGVDAYPGAVRQSGFGAGAVLGDYGQAIHSGGVA